MIPPRYPRSPNQKIITNQNHDLNTPLINNKRLSSQQRKSFKSYENISRTSKYQNIKTQDEKLKALGRRRYINQLAQLDYQDKFVQIHTKYTMASKISVMKKIKSKNQMAQFLQQEQQEQIGFQQLMQYKYGKQNQHQGIFFFQRNQQSLKQFQFCPICDQIHNDHPQVHQNICKQKYLNINNQKIQQYDQYSKQYNYFSLKRINNTINRMVNSSQQYQQLRYIVGKLIQIQELRIKNFNNQGTIIKGAKQSQIKYLKSLFELFRVNQNDVIFGGIAFKILKEMYKKIK